MPNDADRKYDTCCRCQGSGQCHVDAPSFGLPVAMRPIGGFYSCPLCHGTGKMISMESFFEEVQEHLSDEELIEAAHLAAKSLKNK